MPPIRALVPASFSPSDPIPMLPWFADPGPWSGMFLGHSEERRFQRRVDG